jgi:hypothetical protein
MAGSQMADVAQDAWSLSPAEAGQVLSERQADFAAPVPAAEQVQDATDARIRLASLTGNAAWAKKFMEGSIPERQEFEQLTATIAAEAEGQPFVQAPIEMTVGDQSVRRQDLISEISHLSKVGIPEEGVVRTLTGDFSDSDRAWAQTELDRAMATPEWGAALLRGEPEAVHAWTAWSAVIASGKSA